MAEAANGHRTYCYLEQYQAKHEYVHTLFYPPIKIGKGCKNCFLCDSLVILWMMSSLQSFYFMATEQTKLNVSTNKLIIRSEISYHTYPGKEYSHDHTPLLLKVHKIIKTMMFPA